MSTETLPFLLLTLLASVLAAGPSALGILHHREALNQRAVVRAWFFWCDKIYIFRVRSASH